MLPLPIAPRPVPPGTRDALRPQAPWITALAFSLAGAVWMLDVHTGAEVACTLLYLGPIALAVWCVSPSAGLAVGTFTILASTLVRAEEHVRQPAAILAWNTLAELLVFVAMGLLVETLRTRLDEQTRLALSDPLTGLPNRRAFDLALDAAVHREGPVTMVFVDVDDFKAQNDRFGHVHGDAVLSEVARLLRAAVRKDDAVVRLGGDEFGLLMPGADFATARARLRELARSLGTLAPRVTVSMGAVTFEKPPLHAVTVVEKADAAMYRAKRGGVGCVHTVAAA